MDARKLQDLTLSLTKPTKFKISNEGYETSVHANPDQAAFLLPNRQNEIVLSSRVIAGTITIQTDVTADQKEANISPIHKKKTMELPPNLKRRHPVYGRGTSVKVSTEEFHSFWPFFFAQICLNCLPN